MNFKEIREQVLAIFGFNPTDNQAEALDLLLHFMMNRNDPGLFVLRGYAGTGKTSLISAVIRFLDTVHYPCILMAPTGRAAKVFTSYSHHPATTIHKKIYRQKVVDGSYGGFTLDANLHDHTLFFVDEASMISDATEENAYFGTGKLLDDLMKYVYSQPHCQLVLMGDTAQLPPVGRDISPALDKKYLEAFGRDVHCVELTQVVRQQKDSSLLQNATDLRVALAKQQVSNWPHLHTNQTDVIKLQGEDLIDNLTASYDRVGMDECKIVCRSNKRAVLYNQGVRSSILYKEEEIAAGDLLLVAKNNYFWSQPYKEIPFIANGDLVEVVRVRKRLEMHGFHFADVEVRFPEMNWEMEVRIILDSLVAEAPALTEAAQNQLYESVMQDYADCRSKKELYENMRKDPWFNALQVKYGYAMTCHKSQGGQWKEIYLDQGWLNEEMLGVEYYRWLYTALTRATEKVYLVNYQEGKKD